MERVSFCGEDFFFDLLKLSLGAGGKVSRNDDFLLLFDAQGIMIVGWRPSLAT